MDTAERGWVREGMVFSRAGGQGSQESLAPVVGQYQKNPRVRFFRFLLCFASHVEHVTRLYDGVDSGTVIILLPEVLLLPGSFGDGRGELSLVERWILQRALGHYEPHRLHGLHQRAVSININPRTFDDTRTIEQMNLYLDDVVVGTDTNAWRGLHALIAVAEADDGQTSSCFRVIAGNDAP